MATVLDRRMWNTVFPPNMAPPHFYTIKYIDMEFGISILLNM